MGSLTVLWTYGRWQCLTKHSGYSITLHTFRATISSITTYTSPYQLITRRKSNILITANWLPLYCKNKRGNIYIVYFLLILYQIYNKIQYQFIVLETYNTGGCQSTSMDSGTVRYLMVSLSDSWSLLYCFRSLTRLTVPGATDTTIALCKFYFHTYLGWLDIRTSMADCWHKMLTENERKSNERVLCDA